MVDRKLEKTEKKKATEKEKNLIWKKTFDRSNKQNGKKERKKK